ncbi:hypothetical protein DSO57_1016451 [Entomophthora muscae]|uniref:Uncharacterized protein n=1 Tax=Entomophthora muscae TaxID=34485 RepID=A0ACC2T4V6_9FUNG|nr:hypothetical protein DSO57_1016451 [Entomophthora muscae]
MLLFFLLPVSLVLAHMEMTNPAPRRSKHHKGYKDIDYDMTSPLGGRFKFPCRGFAEGPVKDKYTAGQEIDVKIAGGATHGGGHCQFALSFNGKVFVTIHTVFGKCPQPERNFSVKIPKNFPSGKAVFAWVWNNRAGNRELYMNCADIEISGGSGTSYTSPELLIANFPVSGKKVHSFPEGFADDFGKNLFAAQPNITIALSGTSNYQPTTDQEKKVDTGDQQDGKGDKNTPNYPTVPKASLNNTEIPSEDKPEENTKAQESGNKMPNSTTTPSTKPTYMPELNDKKQSESPTTPDTKLGYKPKSKYNKPKSSKERYPSYTSKQSPTLLEEDCEPIIVPEPDCDVQPSKPSYKKPSVKKSPLTAKCVHCMSYCKGLNMTGTCMWGGIKFMPCALGTTCREAQPGQARC